MKRHGFEAVEAEIRREMGLRRHDDVDRQYPMPATLALARAIRREDGQ